MRPFLLLATRADDVVADDEYLAFCRHSGLEESELHRFRLEAEPLPELDLSQYSGVLLGGSPFNSAAPEAQKSPLQQRIEFDLAQLLVEIAVQDFPFFGACYGVGTLGRFAGGHIDETYSEAVGATTVTLTQAAATDPICAGIPATFEAFVGHKEALTTLPPRAVLLATGESCPFQMFRLENNLYATQFHPELDADGLSVRIDTYRDHGYFHPSEADAIKAASRAADVTGADLVLQNFVARYARA